MESLIVDAEVRLEFQVHVVAAAVKVRRVVRADLGDLWVKGRVCGCIIRAELIDKVTLWRACEYLDIAVVNALLVSEPVGIMCGKSCNCYFSPCCC